MKIFSSIFLILCLTAPFFGTFTWLKYEKYTLKKSIKWRMIDGMDRKELVLLKFTEESTKTKLFWEHTKEFEYNGQMYDVVEKSVKGDTIYYYCWWDHEETQLNKQLSALVNKAMGQNPQNRDHQIQLQNFLKNLYPFSPYSVNTFEHPLGTIKTQYNFSSNQVFFTPPKPPPELVG